MTDFDQIIKEHGSGLRRICLNLTHDSDQAKDAFQEVLIRIWKNLGSFRGESSVKTWVSRITVNVCLTFISRSRKNKKIFLPMAPFEKYPSGSSDPGRSAEINQKTEFFRKFFTTLSDADKTLVTLYLEEYTTDEMAEICGLSESNVRVRIHRIKSRIKEDWEAHYESR